MRLLYIVATLSAIALAALAQDANPLVLSSHDRIDGPFAGQYQVQDLRVYENGRVVYVEEATNTMGAKAERSAYEAIIGSDEVRRLAALLDSHEISSLPKKVPSKTRPIDFFWQKSLVINRSGKTQGIQIENFYPFLNAYESVYPKTLIELECSLQDIESEVAKRQRPKDDDDWCKTLLSTSRTAAPAACHEDEAQPKIVAAEGWGAVRIGASSTSVDAFLGAGQPSSRYSDTRFEDYAPKGIQVLFENTGNTVHAIYFYNGQRGDDKFGVFCGRTDRGISWHSSAEEVKRAYGGPTAEYSGTDSGGTWQRLVFAGIDFRFENGKLVRIGVPGD